MAPTFHDFLHNTPAAVAYRQVAGRDANRSALTKTEVSKLTGADVDAFVAGVRDGLQLLRKAAKTATDIVEERIAARINANPVTVTRAIAMREVFEADPALYDRYRAENTVGRDGQVLSRNPSAYNVGVGRMAKSCDESAEAEVLRRVAMVLSKSTHPMTIDKAIGAVFTEDQDLYDRWRAASYA